VTDLTLEAAFAPFAEELERLRPAGAAVLDAHTHLGADEDGQRLTPEALIAFLDQVGPDARACSFPFHDPERSPAYRLPNDRVLDWAQDSGGRIIPYCRLDPAESPLQEAERCLARGARGIKLHPRAQGFAFTAPVIDAIFEVARDARVPILVHAGRGMPPMDDLAAVALRHPEVTLVLAHAAIAGQGMFAETLAEHPAILYDTACFSTFDVVELFARVPAERIVFASDVPYGRPVSGLFQVLRVAALAGLDERDRGLLVGGTMSAALDGEPLAQIRPPRLPAIRPASGPLLRAAAYLTMAFGAMVAASGGPGRWDPALMAPFIAQVRCVCRDPAPGAAGPALARIENAMTDAEHLIAHPAGDPLAPIGLVQAASVIAATERLEA
jgi:predicted TIM-barrel fold metal-dependent hydrolase